MVVDEVTELVAHGLEVRSLVGVDVDEGRLSRDEVGREGTVHPTRPAVDVVKMVFTQVGKGVRDVGVDLVRMGLERRDDLVRGHLGHVLLERVRITGVIVQVVEAGRDLLDRRVELLEVLGAVVAQVGVIRIVRVGVVAIELGKPGADPHEPEVDGADLLVCLLVREALLIGLVDCGIIVVHELAFPVGKQFLLGRGYCGRRIGLENVLPDMLLEGIGTRALANRRKGVLSCS